MMYPEKNLAFMTVVMTCMIFLSAPLIVIQFQSLWMQESAMTPEKMQALSTYQQANSIFLILSLAYAILMALGIPFFLKSLKGKSTTDMRNCNDALSWIGTGIVILFLIASPIIVIQLKMTYPNPELGIVPTEEDAQIMMNYGPVGSMTLMLSLALAVAALVPMWFWCKKQNW